MDLDIEQFQALTAYLRQAGHILPDETPHADRLDGGVSNRTVLVRRANGEAWVLKQALAKLRVQVDWFSSPERVHREAAGLRWLSRLAPPDTIPAFIFEDQTHHILAMSAVPQPHANWKRLLLDGCLHTGHVEQFGRLLGTIHRRAYLERDDVAPAFEDRSFFESLRLEPYYLYSAEQVPAAGPFLRALVDETLSLRLTLVHGDYSPKNILVYQDRLILLDHEVIHFGDPAFDLGFSLTHLLSKAHHLPAQRAAFAGAAQDYWRAYCAALGDVPWAADLEARAVRHTLGCLLARVAGRSQLEYLTPAERARQQKAVINLIARPPGDLTELIACFMTKIA